MNIYPEEQWRIVSRKICEMFDKEDVDEVDALWATFDVLFFLLNVMGFDKNQAIRCMTNHAKKRYVKKDLNSLKTL